MKKYIIIPEFAPLYAMRKALGPQTGPVRKPIPVDIEIIKELLQQKPPVRIYEVKLTNAKLLTYDDKVELNLNNYAADNFSKEEPAEKDSENAVNNVAEKEPSSETSEVEETEDASEPEPQDEEDQEDAAAEEKEPLDAPQASDAMSVELRIKQDAAATVEDDELKALIDDAVDAEV